MRELIPIEPFREWIEKRVEHYRRLGEEPGSERKFNTHVRQTAEDIGVNVRTLQFYRYDKTEIPRANAEECLFRVGVQLWEVYPQERFPELYAEEALKPTRRMLQPELLLRARRLYELGMPMREVAQELLVESGYATDASLETTLLKEFRHQGWPLRTGGESLRLYIGGDCAGWVGNRPCRRRPLRNRKHCLAHDPESSVAQDCLALGREKFRAGWLDARPLSEWMNRRADELGLHDSALARRLGVNPGTVWKYRGLRRERGIPIKWVRPATVERMLAADGTATVAELYPEAA